MKVKFVLLFAICLLSLKIHSQQQIVIKCPECGKDINITIGVSGVATAVHTVGESVAKTNQCKATTAKGTQCTRSAQEGSEFCWQHTEKTTSKVSNTTVSHSAASTINATSGGRCRATTKAGTRCTRTASRNGYCWQHGG